MDRRNDPSSVADGRVNLSERLQFLELDGSEVDRIRFLTGALTRALPGALDVFYDKLRATPQIRGLFADEARIEQAKQAQLQYWALLAEGRFDQQYLQNVRAVGRRHASIGVEPQWYIGGYSLIFEQLLQSVICEVWPKTLFGRVSEDAQAWGRALGVMAKTVLLDIEVATSVYLDALDEKRRVAEDAKREADVAAAQAVATVGAALARLAANSLAYRIDSDMPPAFAALQTDFNGALDKLETTMRRVVEASHAIAGGSDEIAQASGDLSARAEREAAHLEQTSAALGVASSAIAATARNAEEAHRIVAAAQQKSRSSSAVVSSAVEAMGRIEKSSQEIGNIIGVIDEIAFQTNLLALNAGVEAARAGDSGKGFAVVASEVRALAQRSAEAAKNIKQLIHMSGDQVRAGVDLVGQTGAILAEVDASVGALKGVVERIAAGTREQSTTIDEINRAVNDLDQMTQQNAAMAEQGTAASQSLSLEAAKLRTMMGEFDLGEGATNATRRAPALKKAS